MVSFEIPSALRPIGANENAGCWTELLLQTAVVKLLVLHPVEYSAEQPEPLVVAILPLSPE